MLMWTLTVLAIITGVEGFFNGNFPQVCASMSVQHTRGGTTIEPQDYKPPYEIHVSGNPTRGQPITVTLKAEPSGYFRGFMLEARRSTNDDHAVGTFTANGATITRLTCNGVEGSAVSNRNNARKTEISVNWNSDGPEQEIFFRATFVMEYHIFWRPMDTHVISLTTTPQPSTESSSTTPNCPRPPPPECECQRMNNGSIIITMTTTNPATATDPSKK